jgi:translation elongation factor EF-G
MFGYVKDLRSMSHGRATFTMRFDHYAQSPLLPDNDPPFRPAIGMRAWAEPLNPPLTMIAAV